MKNIKKYDDFINESMFSKIKNRKLINKIEELENNGTNDEIIDFLESIIDKTYFPDTAKLDHLRELSNKDEYRANPKDILYSLKRYLDKTDLKNIRIYGPNHGLNTWWVTDFTASFSG